MKLEIKPSVRRLAVALAIVGVPGIADAQQDSSPPAPIAMAETQSVVVAAHYDNAIGTSDAASQGTVRGDRLTDLPLLRPGEVLETVPGLVVTQHSGDGKANQYFLRGYNLDHGTDFASLVDGVPVNMPTNAHGQGYTDLNFLIPELVDRIDYRKGPYFAQDGDFASAGSARIQYVDHLNQGLLNLSVGRDGYRRMLLAGSPANALGMRPLVALEVAGDDGPWTTPEDMRRINGVLRLSGGDRDRGWSADLQGTRAHWTSTDQVPLALVQSGAIGRYSALDPTDGGRSARAVASAEWHEHGAEGYTLVSAFAAHNELTLWSNFTFFEQRPTTGDQFKQQESRNYLGGQVAHGWQHELFGKDSTTEAGLQARYDHVDVGLSDSRERAVFQTVSSDRVEELEAGAYVQNATSWSPWLRSLIGLRADDIRMRSVALQTPQYAAHASAGRISPKLSLVFGPWARTELFANAGRGFHSNDARGVTSRTESSNGRSTAAIPAIVGSRGAEIGLRSEVIPGLQTSLALWRLDSDSELVYSADSGTTDPNGASKRHGVEWNNHLRVNRWLLVDADIAWTRARYAERNANDAAGNCIPNAVGRVGLFGLTVHEFGPWSLGLTTRYIGAYPLSQDGVLTAPSSWISNLQVKRDLAPRYVMSVDVLNLFNRKFYDIAYAQDYRVSPTSPTVSEGVTVHPGEPRQLRIALSVRL